MSEARVSGNLAGLNRWQAGWGDGGGFVAFGGFRYNPGKAFATSDLASSREIWRMTEPIDPKRLESPPWQQGTRLVAGVLIILMGMVVLYLLRGLAAMFLIGLLIAYILHPFASWLERRARFPRWAAALLVLIAFLAVVAGLATGVGLALSQRIIALAAFFIVLRLVGRFFFACMWAPPVWVSLIRQRISALLLRGRK